MHNQSNARLKDIAEEAGLSIRTVSRILNGENKEIWPSSIKRAEEIRAIAKRLNFRPNATARNMRSQSTQMIGVVIHNNRDYTMGSPSNYEFILGLYNALEDTDYELCLVHSDFTHSSSRVFREYMLDNVITLGDVHEKFRDMIQECYPRCIFADTNMQEPDRCIWRDEYGAGKLVGEAIRKRGYKRVCWISLETRHYSHDERLRGLGDGLGGDLLSTLKCYRIADEQQEIDHMLMHVDDSCAVVTYDIVLAMQLQNWMLRRKCIPGVHVGLTCADDSYYAKHVGFDCSRVSYDRFEMGIMAAAMILDQEQDNGSKSRSQTIHGEWLEGSTLKPILK